MNPRRPQPERHVPNMEHGPDAVKRTFHALHPEASSVALTAFGQVVDQLRREQGLEKGDLADKAGIPRTTFWRKLSGKSPITMDDVERIATALGVAKTRLIGEVQILPPQAGALLGDEPPGRDTPATGVPRVMQGLPYEVRVWLQQELLDYAKAGVSERELRHARDLYERPEVFSFYAEGAPHARTEDEVLVGMRALAAVVRGTLRRRGYRLDPDSPH